MDRQVWLAAQSWLARGPLPDGQDGAQGGPRRRLTPFHASCSLHISQREVFAGAASGPGPGAGGAAAGEAAAPAPPWAGPAAPDAVFLEFATSTRSGDAIESDVVVEALQGRSPSGGEGPLAVRLLVDGTAWHLDAACVRKVLVSAATFAELPAGAAAQAGGRLARATSAPGRPEFVSLLLPHVMLNLYQRPGGPAAGSGECGGGDGDTAMEQEQPRPLVGLAMCLLSACADAARHPPARRASSTSSGGQGDPAAALAAASLLVEGAACEAQHLALLCRAQPAGRGAPTPWPSRSHLLDGLGHLHAGLRQQAAVD